MHARSLTRSARRLSWLVVLGLVSAALFLPSTASTLAADPKTEITICHATGADSNPYVVNSPAINSSGAFEGELSGGHNQHTGPIWHPGIQGDWGDIIPPYDYAPTNFHYNGLNWTTAGQAIWNNDCNIPDPTPTPTPTPSPTPDPHPDPDTDPDTDARGRDPDPDTDAHADRWRRPCDRHAGQRECDTDTALHQHDRPDGLRPDRRRVADHPSRDGGRARRRAPADAGERRGPQGRRLPLARPDQGVPETRAERGAVRAAFRPRLFRASAPHRRLALGDAAQAVIVNRSPGSTSSTGPA